jgi:CRP/FNR family transcriptional regulator, cyclic AMP receptor protein
MVSASLPLTRPLSAHLALKRSGEPNAAERHARPMPSGVTTARARRGEMLYSADEPAEQLLVLRSGRAQVYLITDEGKKVVIETVEAPSLLGEAVLTERRAHASSAEATTDCDLLLVDRSSISALLQAQPELTVPLLEAVSARLQAVGKRLEDRSVRAVTARLARALIQLVPGPEYVAYPLKHAEIADVAGTSRETATRVLNRFEQAGLVTLERARIRLLQPNELHRIADSCAS